MKNNEKSKNEEVEQKAPSTPNRANRRANNKSKSKGRRPSKMPKDEIGLKDRNPYYYAPDDTVMNHYTQLSNNMIGQRPIYWGANKLINPGIMRIKLVPSICSSPEAMTLGSYTGVNAACRKLYQELTAFTGRAATSYSAADLGVLLVCYASLIEWVSFAKRIYGTYRLYSPNNRAFNKAALQAQGIKADMDEVFNNLKYLNTVIDQMGTLVIPACPLLIKSVTMYDEIYLDDESDMAQLLIYTPEYYHVLDETTLPTGAFAECHSFTPIKTGDLADLVDFKDVIDIIKSQLDALLTSSTMAIVFADLINYANKVGSLTLIKLLPCAVDYITPVRCSHEEIMRIHNSYFVGDLMSDAEGRVTQNPTYDTIQQGMTLHMVGADGNELHQDVVTRLNYFNITENGILDFTTPDVDSKMMIEATRLICEPKNIAWDSVNSCAITTAVSSGDHIVTGLDILAVDENGLLIAPVSIPEEMQIGTTLGFLRSQNNTASMEDYIRSDIKFAQLSWYQAAPMILVWKYMIPAAEPWTICGRRSFYKTYDLRYMSSLNDRIMQYMYSVIK